MTTQLRKVKPSLIPSMMVRAPITVNAMRNHHALVRFTLPPFSRSMLSTTSHDMAVCARGASRSQPGTVAFAVTAFERRDGRHENPPPSRHSGPTVRLHRIPLPIRRDRPRGPQVPALWPVLSRRRGTPHRTGVQVDHLTIYRWVQRFTPLLAEVARP